ncbi:MAG: hypothetical protein J5535_02485 [Firmicutes bacterium]|nr:hypothetical protein [Bacillota bacterium]
MVTLCVSFAVGIVSLVIGFFVGRRRAICILAEMMAMVDDSGLILKQIKEMTEQMKDGSEGR